MSNIAMIPARMGSQRLKRKNLQLIAGEPLIVHAIRKCIAAKVFDEVWVNSEHPDFGPIAQQEGGRFHQRPEHLGNDKATSEQFVTEFLEKHACDRVFQVHSIAPLLTVEEIRTFVNAMAEQGADAFLSVVDENLECLHKDAPVNFTFSEKTNSQDLLPVRRIVWSITGWQRETFLKAAHAGQCATYAGKVGLFSIDRMAGHVIKTAQDLAIAEALWPLRHDTEGQK